MQTKNKIIVSALLLPAPILSAAGLPSYLNLQPPLNSNLETLLVSDRSPEGEDTPPPARRPAAGPGARSSGPRRAKAPGAVPPPAPQGHSRNSDDGETTARWGSSQISDPVAGSPWGVPVPHRGTRSAPAGRLQLPSRQHPLCTSEAKLLLL